MNILIMGIIVLLATISPAFNRFILVVLMLLIADLLGIK